MKKQITKESSLHQQVVDYLKYQYPKVLFRTDFAAGIKMTIGQAVKHKKLQKCDKWPDIFIAKPKNDKAGLFLELKKDWASLYNKKHQFKNDHIKQQAKILEQLNECGYIAIFSIGFDETKMKIDNYLK